MALSIGIGIDCARRLEAKFREQATNFVSRFSNRVSLSRPVEVVVRASIEPSKRFAASSTREESGHSHQDRRSRRKYASNARLASSETANLFVPL